MEWGPCYEDPPKEEGEEVKVKTSSLRWRRRTRAPGVVEPCLGAPHHKQVCVLASIYHYCQ